MAGIYLHIPFCKQACHYCDFHFSVNTSVKGELVSQMIHELELQKDYLASETIETIYLGGGTPSLLSQAELEALITTIYKHYPVVSRPEITLEANPDDLALEKIRALKQHGINRLSIGIQTFNSDLLRYLNRAHTAHEAIQCVEVSQQAGIENISIDLMFGLPGQKPDQLVDDLAFADKLHPTHISVYSLTIEEKTVFGNWARHGRLKPTDDLAAAQQFELVMDTLQANGFLQYEISNYCKPGFESRHNSSYWQRKKYLGIGPSAHSYNGDTRQYNISNNHRYVQSLKNGQIPFDIEILTHENKINEYIFTSLRTSRGCNTNVLIQDYGYDLAAIHKQVLNQLLAKQLILFTDNTITLTKAGKLLADSLAVEFFAAEKLI